MTEDDDRAVANFLVSQIEFANVIILNKIDLLTGIWQHAGRIGGLQCQGEWWCCTPADERPEDPELDAYIASISEEPFGDRRQEIIMIGLNLDEAEFRARLDQCLLTDAEFSLGPEGWADFEDPIPVWEFVEHSHDH